MDLNNAATQVYRQMMQVDPSKGGKYTQAMIEKMIRSKVDSGMDLQTAQQLISGQIV